MICWFHEFSPVAEVRLLKSPWWGQCGHHIPRPVGHHNLLSINTLLAHAIETHPPWKLKNQGFPGMGSWHLSAWRSGPKSNISDVCASTLSPLILKMRFNLALPGGNRIRKYRTCHHHISLCPHWHFSGISLCFPWFYCQQPNFGVQPLWVCPALQRKGKAKFISPGN